MSSTGASSKTCSQGTVRSQSRRATLHAIAKTIGSRLGWVVISGATGMITARALGPAGRGALAAMIMWPVFLAGALTFGLPSALIFRIRKSQPEERASLFTTATVLALIIGVVASSIAVLILPMWLSRYGPQIVRWTQWLMLFTTVSMLMLIFRSAFEAIEKFGTSASTWLLSPAQTLIALVVLRLVHHLTVVTAALSYVLAGLPVLMWMFLRLHRELGWTFRDFGRSSRDLLGYGIRSYGVDLCGMLSQSVDQALVVGMISASEMGRYVVALSLSRILNSVYQAAAAVLFPKCIGLPVRQSLAITVRILLAATAVAIPGAALICTFGGSLLRLLYGPEYAVAATLLQLLTIEAVLSGFSTIMAQPFMAMGRPGTVTALQATSLAATLPLLLLLVPRLGTVGAGVALLISSIARFLLVVSLYIHLAKRLPNLQDLQSVLAGLPGGFSDRVFGAARPTESTS